MRSPIRSGSRHPIVRGRSQSILNRRPLENALIGVGNAVPIGHLGSITRRWMHAADYPSRQYRHLWVRWLPRFATKRGSQDFESVGQRSGLVATIGVSTPAGRNSSETATLAVAKSAGVSLRPSGVPIAHTPNVGAEAEDTARGVEGRRDTVPISATDH
jgi:hypothetical protein